MMEAIYKELKETLEGLPSPFEDEGKVVERKFSFHEEEKKITDEPANKKVKLEDIDVSYDAPTDKHEAININDDKVKDRWSRYIGAMGIEAVAKQAESRILICGLGAIGVEIAKNIVLAGCKELILFDDIQPIADELSG
jgi:FlaA1/EpsC-like NDP-sugar epimerase